MKLWNGIGLAVLAALFITPQAMAASVGESIPHTLEVKDQNGEVQSFNSLKGEKGAVLYFVRSADWCPYCQVQLLDIRDYGPQIEEAGYRVVSISYDAPEKLKAFADRYKFNYSMLSDEGSEIIKAFDILSENYAPDSFAYGVPDPTIFVVNAEGVITHKFAEDTYKKRPAAEVILGAVQE